MDFKTLETEIEKLNQINVRANYTARRRYCETYRDIYEALLEMDRNGQITIEPGSKGLGYLRELLENDGPEFSYTVIFWEKDHPENKYKIGVCIRGIPICKKESAS
jgi:hypothetical protein